MSGDTPRLRMFAGPNGSGKSTLKTVLRPELLGVYLNPDDMEREVRAQGYLDLRAYGVTVTDSDAKAFFRDSAFLSNAGLSDSAKFVAVSDDRLHFDRTEMNSYLASVAADFIRQRLMEKRATFTLETVMSHSSKVDLLAHAQRLGYRTYLYYVATDHPGINVLRVKWRVNQGGHSVPEDRIRKRYYASLNLLMDAIRHTNRAYIFDNSGDGLEQTWLAEITEGHELEMRTNRIPTWFKHAVLDRIGG